MGSNESHIPLHDIDMSGVLRDSMSLPRHSLGGDQLPPGILDAHPDDGPLQRRRPNREDASVFGALLDRNTASSLLGCETDHDSVDDNVRGAEG